MPQRYGALTALVTGFLSTIGSRREDGGQEMNTNKQPQKRRTARIITVVLLVVVVGLMWLGSNSHLYPGEAVSNPLFLWMIHTRVSRSQAIAIAKDSLANPKLSSFSVPFSKGYLRLTADRCTTLLVRLTPPDGFMSDTDHYMWDILLPAEVVTAYSPHKFTGVVHVYIGADSGRTAAYVHDSVIDQWRIVYGYPPASLQSPFSF